MPSYTLQIILEGKDRASAALGSVQRGISGVATVAGGMIAANVIGKLWDAISSIPGKAIASYTFFERLEFSLKNLAARELLNSGDVSTMAEALLKAEPAAGALLTWTRQLAINSPFSTESVANVMRTALAYGFTVDESKDLTDILVDVAAGAGLPEEKLGLIALALGQIQAKGKLSAQEINQLAETGIPVRQILADAMGISTAAVMKLGEEGKLLSADTLPLIIDAMRVFDGAAAAQTKTFGGLISTLGDVEQIGLKEFFTGTFTAIQPYLDAFVTRVSSPEAYATMRSWGDVLGGYVAGVFAFMSGTILPAFQVAIWFVAANWETFKTALLAVGAVLGGVLVSGAISMLIGLLGLLLSPIGLLVIAAAALGTAWGENWGGIREKTAVVIDWLRDNVWAWLQGTAFPWVIDVGLPALRGAWEAVWPVIKSVVETVYLFFKDVVWAWLTMAFGLLRDTVLPSLRDAFTEIWPIIQGAVMAVFTWLKDTFLPWLRDTAFPWIKDTGLPAIKLAFELVWAAISGAVRAVYLFFKDTVWPWLRDTAFPWLQATALPALKLAFETAWDGIKIAVKATYEFFMNTVWPWLRDVAWPWLKDVALPALTSAFETAWSGIKSAVDTSYAFFRDVVWPWLQTAMENISGWIDTAKGNWSTAWGAISGAVETARGVISGTIETIKSVVDGAIGKINGLITLINNIPGVEIPSIPGVPGFASGVRNFAGGMAIVGERGPELLRLPRGSDVFSNRESRGMLQGGTTITNQYELTAHYRYQDERDLRDDIRMLQLLSPGT